MGVFEVAPFARGTMKIAEAIAGKLSVTSIVGGGDLLPQSISLAWPTKLRISPQAAGLRWSFWKAKNFRV